MPRITPLLIADYIESAFDSLRERGTIGALDRGSLQGVGVLVAMLDDLDEEYLAGLSSADYAALTIATEFVKTTLEGWQYPRNSGRGDYTIVPFVPLQNRHPIVLIRDVMRALPEEPIAIARPQLAFLAMPDLQESIATDVASAESAMAEGRFKTACVMSGAAIEALLLWAVSRRPQGYAAAFTQAQARRGQERRQPLRALANDPKEWVLEQYIEIARELPVLSAAAANASMLAKDFRNLIHPGLAERRQIQATRGAAAQGIAAVTLVVEDLAGRVGAGTL